MKVIFVLGGKITLMFCFMLKDMLVRQKLDLLLRDLSGQVWVVKVQGGCKPTLQLYLRVDMYLFASISIDQLCYFVTVNDPAGQSLTSFSAVI